MLIFAMTLAVMADDVAAVAQPAGPQTSSPSTAASRPDPLACPLETRLVRPRPVDYPDDRNAPTSVMSRLTELPDAAMIRTVNRSFCHEPDVVMRNVSERRPARSVPRRP